MSNEVRPPIDIGGASKGRPGPLDPDENRPRPVPQSSIQRGGGSGGGTSWMPAIIAIVVSVIASAVMVFMFNPAKAGVETLSNQVIQLDQRMSTMEGYATKIDKIDDIDTSLNQLLATSAGYVTQSDLAGITDGMATGDDVATLQASIDALTTENSALADRITELEVVKEEEEEETIPILVEGDVFLDMRGPTTFEYEKWDDPTPTNQTQTWDLLMEVVNETDVDIDNVEIELVIYPRFMEGLDIGTVTIPSSSPQFSWQAYVQGSAIIIVGSEPTWGNGLEVAAGDDENVFIQIEVKADTDPGSDVRFEIETEVTDFKIVVEND